MKGKGRLPESFLTTGLPKSRPTATLLKSRLTARLPGSRALAAVAASLLAALVSSGCGGGCDERFVVDRASPEGYIVATIYDALGIPPDLELRDRLDRPLFLVPDGTPIRDLVSSRLREGETHRGGA